MPRDSVVPQMNTIGLRSVLTGGNPSPWPHHIMYRSHEAVLVAGSLEDILSSHARSGSRTQRGCRHLRSMPCPRPCIMRQPHTQSREKCAPSTSSTLARHASPGQSIFSGWLAPTSAQFSALPAQPRAWTHVIKVQPSLCSSRRTSGHAQELLRKHNEPKRAATSEEAPPASLWHAMQQRQRPSSSSSEEAEQGTPARDGAWREDGTGDLFDSGPAPGRAAAWQLTQPAAAVSLHIPVEEQTRQATMPGEQLNGGDPLIRDGAAAGPAAVAAASRSRKTPGLVPEGSETSNSMMGSFMHTVRRYESDKTFASWQALHLYL